jgi:hypothetical protein
MIALPPVPAPNGVTMTQVDGGLLRRGATGATIDRLNRAGNHYSANVSFPLMQASVAQVFVSRLQRAIGEVLRLELPLLGVSQGSPGLALVDGNGPEGTSLPVRGGTPNHFVREGYWLNVGPADGPVYLHNVTARVRLDASGDGVLPVWPPLRAVLDDGDPVNLKNPFIEGYVTDIQYDMLLGDFVQLGFTIEESA